MVLITIVCMTEVRAQSYRQPIFLFRLWRDVTEALKTNDIESATAGKHKVRHGLSADGLQSSQTSAF